MNIKDLKIGDIITSDMAKNTGIIICFIPYIGVDFGKNFNGHTLDGKLKTPTGYYLSDYDIKSIVKRKNSQLEFKF